MLKLHFAPGTISIAVAIALEETGTPYAAVAVDFANAAQTQAPYLALNPKGRVPVLETPEGILTETGAILEYAGQALVPGAPFQAAKMREVMYFLASTMHVAHAHKMRGSRWADTPESHADMQAKVPETMTACCVYLSENFSFAPFVTGETLTLADCYLTLVLGWAEGDGVDMATFPQLNNYLAMMRSRASVQAVISKGMLAA